MTRMINAWTALTMLAAGTLLAAPASAAGCRNFGTFEQWLGGVKKEAIAQGVSPQVASAALDSLTYDPGVVRRDRGQGVFGQPFLQFSDRMASGYRIKQGEKLIQTHRALFDRIERQFGVPPQPIVAFWALESDFGANNGKFNVLRSLATLAYDCRRPEFFRPQLISALKIVQRGDQRVDQMVGDWAGELGGLQFTPSDYYKYAVDYDGDGRRDLVHSVPDTLASAANFLKGLGWRAGEPWLQEVKVPLAMPWDQADLAIQHPRSQWVAWGVRAAHGSLPSDGLQASLILPQGRLGPAFLGYNNFLKGYLGWNSAFVYSTTAAYLATRVAGAPPVSRGAAHIPQLSGPQIVEVQKLLVAHGYDVGTKIDGKIGTATRGAVKQAQMKLGLPADSYPTAELIEKLRTR